MSDEHEDDWVYTTEPISPLCPFGHPWRAKYDYVSALEHAAEAARALLAHPYFDWGGERTIALTDALAALDTQKT